MSDHSGRSYFILTGPPGMAMRTDRLTELGWRPNRRPRRTDPDTRRSGPITYRIEDQS
jgi:hypothetical protein